MSGKYLLSEVAQRMQDEGEDIPDELIDAGREFETIRDDLDLSGLNVEVIRNWVQFIKILGLPFDNKTRAIVMLLGAVDNARSEAKLWETHAKNAGWRA